MKNQDAFSQHFLFCECLQKTVHKLGSVYILITAQGLERVLRAVSNGASQLRYCVVIFFFNVLLLR